MRCRPAAWEASSGPVQFRPPAIRSVATLHPRVRCVFGVIMCRAHPQSSKPRSQWRVAAVPPGHLLPGIGGKFHGQRLDRDWPMRLAHGAIAWRADHGPRVRRRRHWRLARPPDRGGGQHTDRVRQSKFRDPSSKFAVAFAIRLDQPTPHPAARRRPEPGASAARRSRAWSGTECHRLHWRPPGEPDRRPSPSADTTGRPQAGCPDGWPPTHLPVLGRPYVRRARGGSSRYATSEGCAG